MPKRDQAGGEDKEHAKKEHAKKRSKPSDDVQALCATTASERVQIAAAAVKTAGNRRRLISAEPPLRTRKEKSRKRRYARSAIR